MHYPVMTERQVAARWKLSLKTLRRWRLDHTEPAGISRSRACMPGARSRRRAVLAEIPLTPRVPRVRLPR
jgi:hypothetical protein